MKRIISLILTVSLLLSAAPWAYAVGPVPTPAEEGPEEPVLELPEPMYAVTGTGTTADGLAYQVVDSAAVTITGYAGSAAALTIPDTIDGLPVTSIGAEAFRNCSELETVQFPESLTTIQASAFRACTSLQTVTLPDGVKTIGMYAFQGCTALSSINYPKSWTSGGDHVFAGCPKLTEITVPEGVTALAPYAFSYSAVETVRLPNSLTKIGSKAFYSCKNLTAITIPEHVTEIGSEAFRGCSGLAVVRFPESLTTIQASAFRECTSLYAVTLPDAVKTIGMYAFQGCTALSSINYPKSWTSAGDSIFKDCTRLTTITIPNGATTIPAKAFMRSSIQSVRIPDSVTKIGAQAFAYCPDLEFLQLPQSVQTIGDSILDQSPAAIIYCELNSRATVYAIRNQLPFLVSETVGLPDDGILDRSQSWMAADTNAVGTNGYASLTVTIQIPDAVWAEISKHSVSATVGVPRVFDGAQFSEEDVTVNGALPEKINFNEAAMEMTILLDSPSTEIKFCEKVIEQDDLKSYALLNYYEGSTKKDTVIGIVYDTAELLTVTTNDRTGLRYVRVEGIAPPSAEVMIETLDNPTDGVYYATANKAGYYAVDQVYLGDLVNGKTWDQSEIRASATDSSGQRLEATCMVNYAPDTPELTGLLFYIDGKSDRCVDLYELAQNGVRPSITHTGSKHPYRFAITFENPGSIDRVYVTSSRNNVKRLIEAKPTGTSGVYVAEGYFDEENKLYVPGLLRVEYTLKRDPNPVKTTLSEKEWETFRGLLAEDDAQREKIQVVYDQADRSTGTVDFSGLHEKLRDVVLKYAVSTIDLEASGFKELFGLAETEGNLFSYVVPGLDDERYLAVLDFRDGKTWTMMVADGLDAVDSVYQMKLETTNLSGTAYRDLFDQASALENYAKLGSFLKTAYGICADDQELWAEIMRSATITNKKEMLDKVGELTTDRLGFAAVTAVLPIVLSGGGAPAVVLTAMLGIMTALSDAIYDQRIAEIRGNAYRINWHIDPSGYVYDEETGERLEGVKTTAYWIENSSGTDAEDAAFWENPPADTEYGVLWDSLEYSQENPLYTDAEGRYAWDVPEGWWRVKYEKEGYETVWSDWLPVPPPQTEVNIAMTASNQNGCSIKSAAQTDHSETVLLTNRGALPQPVQLVLAAYDADGRMVACNAQAVELPSGGSMELTVEWAEDRPANTVKAFVLRQHDNTPLRSPWIKTWAD